jgi:LacI family repressor for deo operon, udp, cdd, tsx, nupC, and nupG
MTTVTIRDVAAEAGVSVATVSRALRGLPSVSPATRERVEEAASRLEYVPDPYAARLASTRAHTVIVAVPVPGQWYYAQVVTGIEGVLSDAGYDLQLHVVGDDAQRQHFIEDILPSQRRIDGAILVDIPITEAEAADLIRREIRVVTVGQPIAGLVAITIDNRAAAAEATELLIAAGHRRIALVGGMPHGRTDLTIPGVREIGYREALEAHGIPVRESLILNGNFSIDGGDDAARHVLGREDPPTAIFALSDEMAVGALRAARDLGIAVPDDLCILGFDGHDFAAAIGLSSVEQPVVEFGEIAAQALLDAVDGEPWEGGRILDHHIVLRETTRGS